MEYYKTIQVNNRQVRLHRHLMEQKLGRKLTSNELVHHINGDKSDNRIGNLEIVTRSDHMKMHPEIIEAYKDKCTYKFNIKDISELYKTCTISEIAHMFNVAPMTIWKRLKDAGIKTTKLNNDDVNEIREMIKKGVLQKDIANTYNVSIQLISNIKNNKRYGTKSNSRRQL